MQKAAGGSRTSVRRANELASARIRALVRTMAGSKQRPLTGDVPCHRILEKDWMRITGPLKLRENTSPLLHRAVEEALGLYKHQLKGTYGEGARLADALVAPDFAAAGQQLQRAIDLSADLAICLEIALDSTTILDAWQLGGYGVDVEQPPERGNAQEELQKQQNALFDFIDWLERARNRTFGFCSRPSGSLDEFVVLIDCSLRLCTWGVDRAGRSLRLANSSKYKKFIYELAVLVNPGITEEPVRRALEKYTSWRGSAAGRRLFIPSRSYFSKIPVRSKKNSNNKPVAKTIVTS
jgi:hypothetical protein